MNQADSKLSIDCGQLKLAMVNDDEDDDEDNGEYGEYR